MVKFCWNSAKGSPSVWHETFLLLNFSLFNGIIFLFSDLPSLFKHMTEVGEKKKCHFIWFVCWALHHSITENKECSRFFAHLIYPPAYSIKIALVSLSFYLNSANSILLLSVDVNISASMAAQLLQANVNSVNLWVERK